MYGTPQGSAIRFSGGEPASSGSSGLPMQSFPMQPVAACACERPRVDRPACGNPAASLGPTPTGRVPRRRRPAAMDGGSGDMLGGAVLPAMERRIPGNGENRKVPAASEGRVARESKHVRTKAADAGDSADTPGFSARATRELFDVPDSERGSMPDFLRRLMTAGFSGLFTTESAIRGALGDTLPREWLEYLSEQSDRTRDEFVGRLAREFVRVLENVDVVNLAEQMLTGRTIEVSAQFRLGPRTPEMSKSGGVPGSAAPGTSPGDDTRERQHNHPADDPARKSNSRPRRKNEQS